MSFSPSETGSSSQPQLAKNFSRMSLLGLAFITLNSSIDLVPLWLLHHFHYCLGMRVSKLQFCESDGSSSFVFANFINETGCESSQLLFDRLRSRFSIVIIGNQGPMAWLGFWGPQLLQGGLCLVGVVAIAYISFTTVLFMFPPTRPVTGSTMNYAIATTGAFALLSAIYWFVRGQKRFMQVVVNAAIEFPEARTSIDPIKSVV
ncbi:hypothetical protein CBS147333_9852 [Penicillium roqueforti]|nr:hypothetical protein CBS147333_9852 [Penicillium roqueforti]KAI3189918.1 hypothetical protein CBS147311_9824 [Penicillium roqueforti]KAI3261758.1 hypothetical protein CBS147308_9654 [Penicillium roqueforti]KAI3279471.1 hypothetical protein DTO003C3_9765 [Penicillium roqueforti]KAI3288407.1 hypothetical protein DTO002I6_7355 [Penicillium roqueforti]